MKALKILMDFFLIAIITFVVTALVSFFYSLIAHGSGQWDLELAVRFAVILGIILSWLDQRKK
ncbi:MAG TPA: hypothetical protein PKV90_07740 [Candidatus Saccharicenans sp.]|jgi:uncharacterized membrane protein YdjX (TVP38/TMEM64 family)|nr:hypothetical protein [Candidatus Saccharicenans sp.]HQI23086.1 hypothetical protein [Candidatus Saccharicenans sp.]